MRKKEKRRILILIVITVFVIFVANFVKKDQEEIKPQQGGQTSSMQVGQAQEGAIQGDIMEEFVQKTEDGTKVNVSDKLKETKVIDELEIKDISINEKNHVTQILASIENKSNAIKGDYPVSIFILDKEGKEIAKVGGYIDRIEPGKTVRLNCNVSNDYANAYDIRIEK